jgi:hypothetical protein
MNAKNILKSVRNSLSYAENSDFDPPFWIEPQFLINLKNYALDSRC